jgi:peptidoglycan/LPS O-acetylase OafA/YrhL
MRNRYFDLLRFLAIIRVVVYHVAHWPILTLLFPAMSVMFALAGSLMAASLDKWGTAAVGRRLRRLLPSLWLLAAIFVPAMLITGVLPATWRIVLWAFPLADPPAAGWGALALSVIWYLRDYLWFVLVSPLALPLFRRFPWPTLLAPYLLLVVVELGFPGAPIVLRDFGLYFGAWLLGFAHHDGLLRRIPRSVLLSVVGVLAVFGLTWALTHQGNRAYDLNDIRFANAAWSAAFILLMFGLAPTVRAGWVNRHTLFARVVTIVNRRALTIYLWHMPFVVLMPPMAARFGWSHHDPVGLTVKLVVVFVLVGLAVLAFGWVEDLAARRRPQLVPGASAEALGSGGTSPAGVGIPNPRPAVREAVDRADVGGR